MTGRIIPLQTDRHRQAQLVLAWYAGGRLSDAERVEVETHIAGCPDCQAELKAERRLIAEMVEIEPTAPALDVEGGWARMRAAPDDDGRAPAARPGLAARLSAALARRRAPERRPWSRGPWLPWVMAVQSCAALGLVAVLGVLVWRGAQPGTYRALGSPPATAPGNMVVIFKPETTEAELRAILRASHARLVGGPTSADGYVLRAPDDERASALSALRARPQVVLAEPLDPRP